MVEGSDMIGMACRIMVLCSVVLMSACGSLPLHTESTTLLYPAQLQENNPSRARCAANQGTFSQSQVISAAAVEQAWAYCLRREEWFRLKTAQQVPREAW